MFLKQVYDPYLSQYAYLIGCQKTQEALIIDSERDIDRYLKIAEENDLRIVAATETHIHADFLSGTREFVEGVGVCGYLSKEGGKDWQYEWAQNHEKITLLGASDTFRVGNIEITALHLPGHTPEHLCFLIEDQGGGANEPMAIVSGDFMFVGDVGRPDLLETAAGFANTQEEGAGQLFRSILDFAKLPEFLQVLPGHGAGSSCGKALGSIPFSTTGYELRFNSAVRTALDEGKEAFIEEILDAQPEPPMYFARMKKTNREGAALLGRLPKVPQIECSEIVTLHREDVPNRIFVDTRKNRESFMQGHLNGSIYAPMIGSKFSESVGSYLDGDAEVVLLVESEDQVESCVRQLVRIGIDNIHSWSLIGHLESGTHLKRTETIKTTEMESSDRLLDVRSASEFSEAHVPGAINLAHTRIIADRDRLPEPGPITVHCGSGMRASLASSALERLGFEVTYANGMFADWKKQATSADA